MFKFTPQKDKTQTMHGFYIQKIQVQLFIDFESDLRWHVDPKILNAAVKRLYFNVNIELAILVTVLAHNVAS